MKRLLLTTGGTGGHIFPALAVAEAAQKKNPEIQILFMGSQYGPEASLARAAGLDFVGLPVRGVIGRGTKALEAVVRMLAAFPRALQCIRQFRPQVVAGFGGYAAFVPMLAGRCLGIPCLLHEQNAIAGVSNRLLARLAQTICLSLPETQGVVREKSVLTGNPVRAAIAALGSTPLSMRMTRRVLVMGGSLGAHALNTFILPHLPRLREAGVELCHQTGKTDENMVREAYVAAGYEPGCVRAFIDDMASVYAWADVAVCRAGATSVAELCAVGLPSFLIPFPFAAHDHQTYNAKALQNAGAAVLIPQDRMEKDRLCEQLLTLLADPVRRMEMAEAALRQARPDAAERVLAEITALTVS